MIRVAEFIVSQLLDCVVAEAILWDQQLYSALSGRLQELRSRYGTKPRALMRAAAADDVLSPYVCVQPESVFKSKKCGAFYWRKTRKIYLNVSDVISGNYAHHLQHELVHLLQHQHASFAQRSHRPYKIDSDEYYHDPGEIMAYAAVASGINMEPYYRSSNRKGSNKYFRYVQDYRNLFNQERVRSRSSSFRIEDAAGILFDALLKRDKNLRWRRLDGQIKLEGNGFTATLVNDEFKFFYRDYSGRWLTISGAIAEIQQALPKILTGAEEGVRRNALELTPEYRERQRQSMMRFRDERLAARRQVPLNP